jgi:hypothetical protein
MKNLKPKGFGKLSSQPPKPKKPILALLGDGISPDDLAHDPNLKRIYPNLTPQNFIWIKVDRLEEFCNIPENAWYIQSANGKLQRLLEVRKAGGFIPGQTYTSEDLDWERLGQTLLGGGAS